MLNEFEEQVVQVNRNFRFLPISELEVRAPEWLVQDYIEKNTIAQFFGDPGSYKSFLGIDLSACVVTGKTFYGKAVAQGAALIIAGEGRGGLSRRIKAWEIANKISLQGAPLFISSGPAALCETDTVAEVCMAIEEVAERYGIALVVIDTLARSFGGGDENSTRDMNLVIATLDSIRLKFGCTILLIHHSGHGDKTRGRGAMALKGALDAEFRLDKDESGIVRVEATKMKDAEFPAPMAFTLVPVDLGIYDDDGNEVTSAVLQQTEYAAPEKKTSSGRGKNQLKALNVLQSLYKRNRSRLEGNGCIPDNARPTVDEWRNACFEDGIPRSSFYDCKNSLSSNGIIRLNGNYVQVVSCPSQSPSPL